MPLYEYECDACGRRFERIQKFSDPSIETCSECGGVVRRQVSSPAIQFKGSGFYITDYGKGGEKTTKEDKSGKTTESSSDAKSTETKASTTAETAKPAASSTTDKPKSSS